MSEPLSPAIELLLESLVERIAGRIAERMREAVENEWGHGSPWLSIENAAAYLDLPKQRLYRLTASGQIPHYKQEGRLLFHRGELDEWLASFAQPARTTGSVLRSELSVRRERP